MSQSFQRHFAFLFIATFFWMQTFSQGTLQLLPGTQKIYAIQNGVHRLVGSVSFIYQGNTMYCDSAHYNEKAKEVFAMAMCTFKTTLISVPVQSSSKANLIHR